MSAVTEIIPLEQRLPGFDWQYFLNQTSLSQSFMDPPQWRPSIVPAAEVALVMSASRTGTTTAPVTGVTTTRMTRTGSDGSSAAEVA